MARSRAGREILGYVGEWLGCRHSDAPQGQRYISNVSDEILKRVKLHEFRMADVEDPYLYAAQPLHEFMQTEQGLWIKEHAQDPAFHVHQDVVTLGYLVAVTGYLTSEAETYYKLKWGIYGRDS